MTDSELNADLEQIYAQICNLRGRLSLHPEYHGATAIGFLDVGLEAAQNAIKAGHQCMKGESGSPPVPIDYEVEYGMTPMGDLCRQS